MLVVAFLAVVAAAPQAPQDATGATAVLIEHFAKESEADVLRRATREQSYEPVEGADTKPEPGRTIRLPD